jgi:hypothetical protein
MRGTWETVVGMDASSVAGRGVAGRVAVGSAAVAVAGIGISVVTGGAVGCWQLINKNTVTNRLMVDNLIIFILLKDMGSGHMVSDIAKLYSATYHLVNM